MQTAGIEVTALRQPDDGLLDAVLGFGAVTDGSTHGGDGLLAMALQHQPALLRWRVLRAAGAGATPLPPVTHMDAAV